MIRIVIFYAILVAALAYGMRRGGAPERWIGAMMVAAAVATSLLPVVPRITFFIVEWPRLAIDVGLLGGMIVVALLADRFWPIYIAAIQLVTVMAHGVRAIDPGILPIVYTRVTGWMAYPLLTIFIIGVYRHARRHDAGDQQFDWTRQRYRYARRGPRSTS